MTGWWKAITKNTHNADWVSDLVEVENSIGSEDTADVTADDLVGKKIFSKFSKNQQICSHKYFSL